jgi:Protein of unknown function (DUF3592)
MKGRIFLFLFGLPFFGVGAWMAWSIGSTLYDAKRMQHWVPVRAQLLDAGYHTHAGDDSDTYEAYARYDYTYRGRTWTGSRVTLGSGADNIGDYQQDTGRRLAGARSRGETIEVWVDPDDPGHSIVDRGIRWGMIGFKAVFVVVFGGVGSGLLIWTWRAPKPKDASDPKLADAPWLADAAWQTATVRSNSRTSMYFAWGFAVLWNAISSPIPFLTYGEVVNHHNYVVLIGLVFPLVGAGLLIWAIRRTLEWRRFGQAPVTLDPFPGSIGGHVGGTIDLRLPFDATAKFRVTLTNLHSTISGGGNNRNRSEKALWQDAMVAHAEPCALGTRLVFRFDVPEGLGESDTEHDDSYKLWRLNLAADLPGTDLDRNYEIPVYATAQQSRLLSERAVAESREAQHALDTEAVRERVHLGYGLTGRRMFFPAGRFLGSSLAGLIVGAIFAGVGWFLIVKAGHAIFGGVFGGMGALVALSCLYVAGNSLEVLQTGDSIRSVRRVLGIPVRRREMRLDNIKDLGKKSNMQAQSGGKYVMFYSVFAVDYIGNKLALGEGFRGEHEANAAMELIRREFGIRQDEDTHQLRPNGRPNGDTHQSNPLDDDHELDHFAANI